MGGLNPPPIFGFLFAVSQKIKGEGLPMFRSGITNTLYQKSNNASMETIRNYII
jgi:hypothetical protein